MSLSSIVCYGLEIRLIILELFADQRAGKALGVKRLQIIDRFAYADEIDRKRLFTLGGDRHQNAAFGGAVQFGNDKTGEAGILIKSLNLRKRVLTVGAGANATRLT